MFRKNKISRLRLYILARNHRLTCFQYNILCSNLKITLKTENLRDTELRLANIF